MKLFNDLSILNPSCESKAPITTGPVGLKPPNYLVKKLPFLRLVASMCYSNQSVTIGNTV